MSSLYAAVKLALELGADIICLSVYANKTDESTIVVGAIEDAIHAGVKVIGAAGNSGSDAVYYVPGCVSGAIIAGSLSQEHTIQPFSNYGATVDYYVESSSTSEAAAKLTGYYSLTKADFSDIDCESVYRIACEGVSNYSALDTDDFVTAWSGWPISLSEVTGTPVGVVSAGKIYFGVGGYNTHNYYIQYDGAVSDWTGVSGASAYGYCLDSEDNGASYDAAYVYELNIASYPVLAAAVITAPGARAKNNADMSIPSSRMNRSLKAKTPFWPMTQAIPSPLTVCLSTKNLYRKSLYWILLFWTSLHRVNLHRTSLRRKIRRN